MSLRLPSGISRLRPIGGSLTPSSGSLATNSCSQDGICLSSLSLHMHTPSGDGDMAMPTPVTQPVPAVCTGRAAGSLETLGLLSTLGCVPWKARTWDSPAEEDRATPLLNPVRHSEGFSYLGNPSGRRLQLVNHTALGPNPKPIAHTESNPVDSLKPSLLIGKLEVNEAIFIGSPGVYKKKVSRRPSTHPFSADVGREAGFWIVLGGEECLGILLGRTDR